jgi:3-phenylpropionate/trans-cinnamate dioxygenase ferredoxin subunit
MCVNPRGVPVAVVRCPGNVVKAVHNKCGHEQYDLAPEGWIEDNRIECALHGSMFDLDTGMPDAPPATAAIPVYAAKVENGMIYVDVEQQLNDAPVPKY